MAAFVVMLSELLVRSTHGENRIAPAGSGADSSRSLTSRAIVSPPPAESPATTTEPASIPPWSSP